MSKAVARLLLETRHNIGQGGLETCPTPPPPSQKVQNVDLVQAHFTRPSDANLWEDQSI